jgi:hypothetical protein
MNYNSLASGFTPNANKPILMLLHKSGLEKKCNIALHAN